jgi:hypothetical protein
MNSAAARTKLLNSPEAFLKYYPVKCAGAPAPVQNAVNLAQYNINKHGGDQPAVGDEVVGHRGATRPGILGIGERQISSFKLEPGAVTVNGAIINNAHVVPMVNYNSDIYGCLNLLGVINNMPYYVLDGNGDGLMVTGELSNCCFCWLPRGNDLWCIHVQPVGGIMPIQLQNALAVNGRFTTAPVAALGTYGRNDYPAGRASIIGVRHAGVWRLYAQTSNDSFRTLSGAFRIYPGVTQQL